MYDRSVKIAILGYGVQGRSAYEYWKKSGAEITICDYKTGIKLPPGTQGSLGEDYLKNLEQYDTLVRSPSVKPEEIVKNNSPEILNKITSVTNEFLKICPTKNIIGVTGTKGKGTTSMLLTKMLKASGKSVHLGGNIGTPPLDLLKNNIQESDWVVLELANFQTIDLVHSPHIAVCLLVVPEHLDWHSDELHYYDSKKPMFKHQTEDDFAIYFSKNKLSEEITSVSKGQKIPYYEKPGAIIENNELVIANETICSVKDFKLPGEHNWQNICAATTAFWQIENNVQAIQKVAKSFSGLPYRLELVREVKGVKYYNDSFGTAPETAQVAIKAFTEPKILILGGSDKGLSFSGLAKTVSENNVKKVLLIGLMAEKIREELEKAGYKDYVPGGKDIDEIVQNAQKAAEPGDVVLFSTACASFDMFENYKDRGDKFNRAVIELS